MRRYVPHAGWPRGPALLMAFYLIWLAPRLGVIVENPLALDDFYIGVTTPRELITVGSAVHLYSWRPVLYLEYLFFDTLMSPFGRPFVFAVLPKLIAGLLVSTAAMMAYRTLRCYEVARPVAFLCLAVFLVHPVVNEITLWNTVHALPLALCFALLGDRLLDSSHTPNRISLACTAVVLAVLTYQVYLIVILIMAGLRMTLEGINARQVRINGFGDRLTVFSVAAVLYLAYMWISTTVFEVGESRGIVRPESISALLQLKYPGIVNLLVNVTMPIISYYAGISSGWKHWAAPFFAVAGCAMLFLTIRRDHFAVVGLVVAGIVGMPILAALPIIATSQSPEAWRVAVPATLAFALSLAALGHLASVAYAHVFKGRKNPVPWIVGAVAALIAIAVGIVAHYEAQQRIVINRADQALSKDISRFWAGHGKSLNEFFVGRVTVPGLSQGLYYTEPPDLTTAYKKFVPPSAFDNEFSWRGFLAYRGMRSAELETVYGNSAEVTAALCVRQGLHCALALRPSLIRRCVERPDYTQDGTGRRVIHLPSEGLSVVCARSS